MSRWVRHKTDEGKALFDFSSFSAFGEEQDFVFFLSERDRELILQNFVYTDQLQTRVFTNAIGDRYEIANDVEFELFAKWVSDLRGHLGEFIVTNEYLERIAIAVEAIAEDAEHSTLNLSDLLEALNIDPTEEQEDLIEALTYLTSLFPGLPELKIPNIAVGEMIGNWRFNGSILNLLEDIAISQRGQTVALGGADFAGIYNSLGDTAEKLLLPAGYVGKAIWLWNRIKPVDTPGWVGWLLSITGAVFGSVRDAGYTIADKIDDLAERVAGAIQDATDQNIINCNNCTSTQLYNILNDHTIQSPYAVVENDSVWIDPNEPPTSEDAEWAEPSDPDATKCQGSRYIVGWLIGFYGQEEWDLETTDNTMSLADKFRIILAIMPPIGVALNGLSRLIGRTLAYLSSGDTDIFNTLNEVLVDLQEDLVCAIHEASGPVQAREDFIQIIRDDGRLTGIEEHFLDVFLTTNNVMALPFYENDEMSSYIDHFGTECDCEDVDTGPYTIEFGSEVSEHPANPIVADTAYDEDVTGCGGNVRVLRINFHAAVTITHVLAVGTGCGACGGNFLYNYFSAEDYIDLIQSGNGRPQDTAVVPAVRSLIFVFHCDGDTPEVTITYTTD